MAKYKCVFFDWDGTAVESRTAPAEDVLKAMVPVLRAGVKLIIVSGTTIENIAEGSIEKNIPEDCLGNLYLGLGRGAFDYGFKDGKPVIINSMLPDKNTLLKIHSASFDLHTKLLRDYDLNSDIVFSRPNYCKVDLMADHDRGGKLFLQQSEIGMVQEKLKRKGISEGLADVIRMADDMGTKYDLPLCSTTDAKYIEIGITTKSDNVDYFMKNVLYKEGIKAEDCCFVGDEFTYFTDGIRGSDAYMITEATKNGTFIDVSENPWKLPDEVRNIGGGVSAFKEFLSSVL